MWLWIATCGVQLGAQWWSFRFCKGCECVASWLTIVSQEGRLEVLCVSVRGVSFCSRNRCGLNYIPRISDSSSLFSPQGLQGLVGSKIGFTPFRDVLIPCKICSVSCQGSKPVIYWIAKTAMQNILPKMCVHVCTYTFHILRIDENRVLQWITKNNKS
jgi:hypothetical protein